MTVSSCSGGKCPLVNDILKSMVMFFLAHVIYILEIYCAIGHILEVENFVKCVD